MSRSHPCIMAQARVGRRRVWPDCLNQRLIQVIGEVEQAKFENGRSLRRTARLKPAQRQSRDFEFGYPAHEVWVFAKHRAITGRLRSRNRLKPGKLRLHSSNPFQRGGTRGNRRNSQERIRLNCHLFHIHES